MSYLISFLEGIITFLSPCLLPLLPIYLAFFAASSDGDTRRTLRNAFGFVLGFTVVFLAFGALAGTLGALLVRYQHVVDIVCGILVILFGLSVLDVLPIPLFRERGMSQGGASVNFWTALVFGIIFSVGWTPCVGPFLGAALVLAGQKQHLLQGMLLLLCYSAGLGIPYLLSALLIDQLSGAFDWIKRHYRIIRLVSGILLILIGVLMLFGLMGRLMALLA